MCWLKIALLTLGNYSLRSDLLLMNFLVLTGGFFLPEVCASCQWAALCMITVYDHIIYATTAVHYLSQLAIVNMEAKQFCIL